MDPNEKVTMEFTKQQIAVMMQALWQGQTFPGVVTSPIVDILRGALEGEKEIKKAGNNKMPPARLLHSEED
jgi:hypothetical protein